MAESAAKSKQNPRVPMPEQDPKVRARNFLEVPTGYTIKMAQEEASRCLQCKKPACVQGCPVGVDIPGFIDLLSQGDMTGAIRNLWGKNALPAVCGRVCPQESQCEGLCIVGRKGHVSRFRAPSRADSGVKSRSSRRPPPAARGGRVTTATRECYRARSFLQRSVAAE